MNKRFVFLHDFKFPLETFKSIYLQVVELCLEESKFQDNKTELIKQLNTVIKPIFGKFTESRVPLISVILRNAYNYCQLLDTHPNTLAVARILFPEMAESLEMALESYVISKEADYDYNHYCSNAVNSRLITYKSKLQSLVEVYDKIT